MTPSAPVLVDGVLVWTLEAGTAATTTAVVAATEAPTPLPGEEEQTGYNSPGVMGFLVTFALVLACIPLFMSMVRKVRGVQHKDGGPTGPAEPPASSGDGPAPGP